MIQEAFRVFGCVMKPLSGLPVDAFVQVSQDSEIPLKDLLELVQQVENGASPAFLARYRADLCGGLDEERIHGILNRLKDHQDLIDHRISMLTTLSQRGILTPELKKQLEQAGDRNALNDVFAPYRARKPGQADLAAEKGLDPLARTLWFQKEGLDLAAEAASHVDPSKGIESAEHALDGAYAIASQWLSDKPEILHELRKICHCDCEIVVAAKPAARKEPRYQALDGFRSKVSEIAWQRRLAIRRGARTGLLDVKTEFPFEAATNYLERRLIENPESIYGPHLQQVVRTALRDGLVDRVKKDVLRQLDRETDSEAIDSYRKALREALLAPVAHGLNIVGVETGRPGGWRAALIDGKGQLVDFAIIRRSDSDGGQSRVAQSERPAPQDVHLVPAAVGGASPEDGAPPLPGSSEESTAASSEEPADAMTSAEPAGNGTATDATVQEAAVAATKPSSEDRTAEGSGPRKRDKHQARHAELSDILSAHEVDLIVFPSGPRQRSAERFLRSQIRKSGRTDTAWLAIRDSGTWIYATSRTAKREFPHLEPAFRSAVSLARRVQDPMAELIKTDPRTVGIGSHHHEVNAERLREALGLTVQRAVHDVGVDVNRASAALLSLVPGFTERLGKRVVDYRDSNGPFRSRADLIKVDGLSERIFAQAVGFLRVYGGDPLDGTGIHPEYRELNERFADAAGCDLATLLAEPERLDGIDPAQFATPDSSVVFVQSALEELKPSRRDVRRKFETPEPPVPLRPDEELLPGSKIDGLVASVADFGVFVDIGADQDALLHVSQITSEHKKESKPSLRAGDRVEVFIKPSDQGSKRIGLSMWDPRSRPARNRNGSRPPGTNRQNDGRRRHSGPKPGRTDRRKPFNRTFGPDSERRRKGSRPKMSMEEKLGMLQDKYRTKV